MNHSDTPKKIYNTGKREIGESTKRIRQSLLDNWAGAPPRKSTGKNGKPSRPGKDK